MEVRQGQVDRVAADLIKGFQRTEAEQALTLTSNNRQVTSPDLAAILHQDNIEAGGAQGPDVEQVGSAVKDGVDFGGQPGESGVKGKFPSFLR